MICDFITLAVTILMQNFNNTNLPAQANVLLFLHLCFLKIDLSFCEQSLNPPVLVFVQNKERAKELYDELYDEVKFDDIRADVIHADLSEIQVIFCKMFSLLLIRFQDSQVKMPIVSLLVPFHGQTVSYIAHAPI